MLAASSSDFQPPKHTNPHHCRHIGGHTNYLLAILSARAARVPPSPQSRARLVENFAKLYSYKSHIGVGVHKLQSSNSRHVNVNVPMLANKSFSRSTLNRALTCTRQITFSVPLFFTLLFHLSPPVWCSYLSLLKFQKHAGAKGFKCV